MENTDTSLMVDFTVDQIIEIMGIFITVTAIIVGYCVRVELKFRELESGIKVLNPVKHILEQRGVKHFTAIFGEEKP